MIELTTYEDRLIETKLPPHLSAFKTKYPNTVFNAAFSQDLPTLSREYQPESIDIYYGEENNPEYLPNISIDRRRLNFLHLTKECEDNPVIQIEVDGDWAYIEIEQQILLDRMGEVKLPDIEITEEALLKTYELLRDKT